MISHTTFGIISVILAVIGYIPYYRNILRGHTKPHPYTWFGFSLLNGVTFVAQVVTNGGAGAWVTLVTTIGTFGIFLLSIKNGEQEITKLDKICLGGAIASIAIWKFTDIALYAVIIVTIADLLACIPTIRKAYLRPNQETATTYAVGTIKYIISLFALSSINLTTVLFPISIAVFNFVILIVLLIRRSVLS